MYPHHQETKSNHSMTDAHVHVKMHMLGIKNCQHTHYNHIFICSCGAHLWLVSNEHDCNVKKLRYQRNWKKAPTLCFFLVCIFQNVFLSQICAKAGEQT